MEESESEVESHSAEPEPIKNDPVYPRAKMEPEPGTGYSEIDAAWTTSIKLEPKPETNPEEPELADCEKEDNSPLAIALKMELLEREIGPCSSTRYDVKTELE